MPWNKLALKLGGKAEADAKHFPFEIFLHHSDTQGYYVTVRPGSVTSILPANILDIIYINGQQTSFIKLQCQTNGRLPTYVWVFDDPNSIDNNNATFENIAPSTFEIILGMIVPQTGGSPKVYQIVYNNLMALPDIAFLASIDGAVEPGREPYTRWWVWKITSL